MKNNLIQNKTFSFALDAIQHYKILNTKKEYILSKQFLKSATSIGANVEEGIAAFSKRDFIFKMSIAFKEARESLYWIKLIEASQIIEYNFDHLKTENQSIINILSSIIKTSRENQ